MFVMRKIAMSVAALFLGLSAVFMVTGVASADGQPVAPPSDIDWH